MHRNLIGFVLLFFFSTVGMLTAQITGHVENFDDNSLDRWEYAETTFFLTAEDGVLRIDYNRTTSSWEWDNFNFTPPEADISGNPVISVRVKSDVASELTFKPVYSNGQDDWLQVSLTGDEEWHTCFFRPVNAGGTVLTKIYMYLDGGTNGVKSGTVFFDDLRLGDSVVVSADFAALERAVGDAENLYENTVEGDGEGQFQVGTKADLKKAIDSAGDFLNSDSSSVKQTEIDSVVSLLYDACVTYETGVRIENITVTDILATKETKYLYSNLVSLSQNNILFGMHDATGYGVGWNNDNDRSDVKDVCGSYPAIYSWDVYNITRNSDLDGVRYRIVSAYERGGINTLCWHQNDPLNRGFYAADVNNERIVSTILPGGEYHESYRNKLEKVADFIKSLRGPKGESIPVIFRPYHEHNGAWFWWGEGHCSEDEFLEIWRFTEEYLRDSLNVHSFLYAFSPSGGHFDSESAYLHKYPGDDYIDIFGMDYYFRNGISSGEMDDFLSRLRYCAGIALQRNKLPALTEVGEEAITSDKWFTTALLEPFKTDTLAGHFSYAAVWRNASVTHHYAPYPGHSSVPDFLEFFNDFYSMFEDDLPDVYSRVTEDSVPPEFKNLPVDEFISWDTLVRVEVQTNERAYLRYGYEDMEYEALPFEFSEGQGGLNHRTFISSGQGETVRIYVRAKDMFGNVTPSSTIINYSVDTLSAPVNWQETIYKHTLWKAGYTPSGYGFDDIATVTGEANTTYFVKYFNIQEPESLSYLSVKFKYDDGGVIYLNGTEVRRYNLDDGEIDYDTYASGSKKSSRGFKIEDEELEPVRKGENMLAVEIHQADDNEEDLYFDCALMTETDTIFPYGSEWFFYDAGNEPESQTLRFAPVPENGRVTGRKGLIDVKTYPNPFMDHMIFRYRLAKTGRVEVAVYNILGQEIRKYDEGIKSTGDHTCRWSGEDGDGKTAGPGLYVYSVKTEKGIVKTGKMIKIQ